MGKTCGKKKKWWAPVWTGLVVDKNAKHFSQMGKAVWLFIYLILHAERQTGVLYRKIKTIASDTGIKQRTLQRWLRTLKESGYITTKSTGRYLLVQIEKWRPIVERPELAFQSGQDRPVRVAKSGISKRGSGRRKPARLSGGKAERPFDNERTINRDILKSDIDSRKIERSPEWIKQFKPQTKQELLAVDLAKSLNDFNGLPLYLTYAKKYPASTLLKVLGLVKEVPAHKIKKSRGALFNYLVQQYDQEDS